MSERYVKLIKALERAEAKAVELEGCILDAARFAIRVSAPGDHSEKMAGRLADEMLSAAQLGCRLSWRRKTLEDYDHGKYEWRYCIEQEDQAGGSAAHE